jgi:hypothetical protein
VKPAAPFVQNRHRAFRPSAWEIIARFKPAIE